MTTPGAVPATMGKRLLAHLIDQVAYLLVGGAFVLAGLAPLLGVGGGAQAGADTAPSASPLTPLSLIGGVLLLGVALVQWWYQGTRGFTIGKRLVGLRTVSAETGRPVGMGRILLRGLVVAAGTLVVGVGQLVVYLSPFFDATGRRQGWHDKAAGTMVFDVAVGRDPAEVDQVRGAAEALQRLDALMGAGHRSVATGSQGARVLAPEAPEMPQMPQVPVIPQGLEAPVVPQVVRPPVPTGPVLAPRLPARSTVPVPAGVISSVPGRASADDSSVPARASSGDEPAPTRGPVATSGLAEDVEMTRLRPARGKVPEVPGDGQPEATIELTDGRRFTVAGIALVGRRPGPRTGETKAQLIRVADPGRSVSKTHLAIGVDRAGVWIRDRDSTNGTVVTLADGQQILCAAEQQVRVPPGASVSFGDYGLTVTADPGSAGRPGSPD